MRFTALLAAFALLIAAPASAQAVIDGVSAQAQASEATPDEASSLAQAVAQALPPGQQAKLTASDAEAGDNFGRSVSVSGETAIVGAFNNSDDGDFSGSAYVFVRDGTTWTQQAKLTSNDAARNDRFGWSVSLSGDTAVIGADFADDGSGAAYVFVRDGATWTQQAKLKASDAAADDRFGFSVSVSGETAIVGAYWDDNPREESGSAYVFVRDGTGWTQQAKLAAADAAPFDQFGRSVSVSGETALVGANNSLSFAESGSAYVFVRNGTTWTRQAKLTAPDATTGDRFGASVSVSGETAIIGARRAEDDAGFEKGAAYVFVRNGTAWTRQAKLTATDAGVFDDFGDSVALSGNTAVVGASRDFVAAVANGSAYVFVRTATGWTQQAKLTAADGASSDFFGTSVSISGETAIVGAHFDDDAGTQSGSAYVFTLSGDAIADNAVSVRARSSHAASAVNTRSADDAVSPAWPNPTRGAATITVTTGSPERVRVSVHDAMGRRVALAFEGVVSGRSEVVLGSGLAPGVYAVRVEGETFAEVQPLTVIR